jgi:general secretion pathway protein I
VSDGAATQDFPVTTPADVMVSFLSAQKFAGGSVVLAGQVVESEALKFVTFYSDGTCTAFRLQIRTGVDSHVLSIDPWTCAPVLTPKRRPIHPRSAGPAAFTLMEVLVALLIFALTAVVLGSAYVNVLHSYQVVARANQANEDLAFARAQLLAEPDRKAVELGDEFESTNNRRVKWTGTVATTSINDLFTVTFVCEITDPARIEPEITTQTFTVLRPTWSDPAERGQLLIDIKARIAELQGKKPL